MIRYTVKDGVEVSITNNGAILTLTSDVNPYHQVLKVLTIADSLSLAQALIQAGLFELGVIFKQDKPTNEG